MDYVLRGWASSNDSDAREIKSGHLFHFFEKRNRWETNSWKLQLEMTFPCLHSDRQRELCVVVAQMWDQTQGSCPSHWALVFGSVLIILTCKGTVYSVSII